MERRTKALYDAVFEYLSLTFPHFVNQSVVTDYEMALVESLKAAYPQASLHGCFFHFCQVFLIYIVILRKYIQYTIHIGTFLLPLFS